MAESKPKRAKCLLCGDITRWVSNGRPTVHETCVYQLKRSALACAEFEITREFIEDVISDEAAAVAVYERIKEVHDELQQEPRYNSIRVQVTGMER